jgi:hypothetical protein
METDMLLDDQAVKAATFREFTFPIEFKFKIGTLANDFVATDANGQTVAYVRQKMFKLKEAIMVYTNESKSTLINKIEADRIIDFNASYSFKDAEDNILGRMGRRGMKSLWKASYDIFGERPEPECSIREENPWAKVGDAMLREIPVVGIFAGYLCNPKYAVINAQGEKVARLAKTASFFGRKFKLTKLADFNPGDDERILLSLMMMILLERRRG